MLETASLVISTFAQNRECYGFKFREFTLKYFAKGVCAIVPLTNFVDLLKMFTDLNKLKKMYSLNISLPWEGFDKRQKRFMFGNSKYLPMLYFIKITSIQ